MNTNERKAVNAMRGKNARACESCLKKRARWYCTADDAFLCQSCDALVHSANLLASRHDRVRLKASSNSSSSPPPPPPSWHEGFTRKARTPRQNKAVKSEYLVVVPDQTTNGDIDQEYPFLEENEEEEDKFHNYRVPVFYPFDDNDFCNDEVGFGVEEKLHHDNNHHDDLNIDELMSCGDLEFAEFAADVESLLGTGSIDELSGEKLVKFEEVEKDPYVDELMSDEVQVVTECQFDPALDMEMNFDFGYADSTSNGEYEENKKEVLKVDCIGNSGVNDADESGSVVLQIEKRMLLRLNHEAVMDAWASQGSPWTNGVRPDQFNIDEFTVACLGGSPHDLYGLSGVRSGATDAQRKERVSRYKEKRRTRLFSKKIRYEVRKLNAEKRPRMKGRFVKRTNISDSPLPYLV